MKNYPFLWFKNITALLEKREYHTYNIFLFSLFVGSFRRFLEWTMGGVTEPFPFNFIITLTSFYWFSFFIFTLILHFLVPQHWRISINVILVGIFLGIFPPILDTLISGTGFSYAYVWALPETFNWYLYNPHLNIPIGEAIVLWAAILFTTLYVGYKTRRVWKTVLALVAAYATVLVIGGVLAGTAAMIRTAFDWESTHQVTMVNLLQIMAAFLIYLILQPGLARGLLSRVPIVLPLVALCVAGSAWTGSISVTTISYAVLLFLFLLITYALHDFWTDRDIDFQAGQTYLDVEDARFLTLTAGLFLAALTAANSAVLLPLLLLLLLAVLYFAPFSRGRDEFPYNILIRGALGASAFFVGIVAGLEQAAYGAPRWWIAFLPVPTDPAILSLDGFPLWVMSIVFLCCCWFAVVWDCAGGSRDRFGEPGNPYPLVSDVATWSRFLRTGATLMVLLGPAALAVADQLPWIYTVGGLPASMALWIFMARPPSPARGRLVTVLLTVYLVHIAVGIQA